MKTKIYSQNEMESAVEIAYLAGFYGFQTPNSRDMMSSFHEWAVEFEKTPYEKDEWMELIDTFGCEMLLIEVEQGRATFNSTNANLKILDPKSFEEWSKLLDNNWVYLPFHGDRILTKSHFVKLCEGNVKRAYELYRMCEWQHPATIIDESRGLENLFAEETA